MIGMDFKKEIISLLQKEIKQNIPLDLEVPPDATLGDFAFPCFTLARFVKKNPIEIAKDLAARITASYLEKVEAQGPYVNFFINKAKFCEQVITQIQKQKEKFGAAAEKKKILLEFPSPNTNKPLHLGHIRNMTIGQSIANIYTFLGNKVKICNLNNDCGIHICKSMLAYKKWGNNKLPDKKPDHFVGDFYVLYAKNENDQLKKELREMLIKWEKNDTATRALWKKMRSWALKGFQETYKKMGLTFDKTYNEYELYDKGKAVVLDALKKGILYKDPTGAIMVNLEQEHLGKEVLLRADGTSLYHTQDIYVAKKKDEDFKPNLSVYIVGSEQNYHFKVLFTVLKKLGFSFADTCFHLNYGMVFLPEGKMKSREGTVVDADDIIQEMESLAQEEIQKRYKDLSKKERERRAKIIAMAALRYFMLKTDTFKDITFDPKESISFEGDTGPYIQYTYARLSSIIKKYGKKIPTMFDAKSFNEAEFELIKVLDRIPETIQQAKQNHKPSLMCHALYELCQKVNNYYETYPILKEPTKKIQEARLILMNTVRQILKTGLALLNIEVLEEM